MVAVFELLAPKDRELEKGRGGSGGESGEGLLGVSSELRNKQE